MAYAVNELDIPNSTLVWEGKGDYFVPNDSVLAWRIPGKGEPGGLLSMGSHRVGHD